MLCQSDQLWQFFFNSYYENWKLERTEITITKLERLKE